MLTNLLQTLVSLIDTVMVGRLGPIAIAAVGMSNMIRMLIMILALGIAGGAISLIAQARGARDPEQQSLVIRQSISAAVVLGTVLGVVGYFGAETLLALMNQAGDPEAVALGKAYLQLLFLGLPFLFLNMIIDRLMQGAGDTVTPLYLNGSLNVVNVGLNYVFMFGLGPIAAMGVSGAAMGTLIARGLAVVIAFWLIYTDRNALKLTAGSYRPNWQMQRDIFAIGMPSGIQGVFRNGARILVFSFVAATSAGTLGVAALTIGIQLEALALLPTLGLGVSATSLVGRSVGKWQIAEARRWGTITVSLSVLFLILMAFPIYIFAPQILRLFDPEATPGLMSAGITYLRISAFGLPFIGMSMCCTGALRGAGDTVPALIATVIFRAIVGTALAYLFAFTLGWDTIGIWYALVLAIMGNGIFMLFMWAWRPWSDVALSKTALYRTHLKALSKHVQQTYLAEVKAPFMAIEGIVEAVSDEGVIYANAEQSTQVLFTGPQYEVQQTQFVS